MPNIKVKIVPWRRFPEGHRAPNTLGSWMPKEETIYLQKGKWTPHVLEHELGHALLPEKEPETAAQHVRNEINAELFGYIPPSNLQFLYGLVNSTTEEYYCTPSQAVRLIETQLGRRKNKIPPLWWKQLARIRKEAKEAEK